MLDIQYRIPLEIRDTALRMAGLEGAFGVKSIPDCPSFRETKAIKADQAEAAYRKRDEQAQSDENETKARDMLEKLSQRLAAKNDELSKPKEQKKVVGKTDDVQKIVAGLPFGGLLADKEQTCTSFFVFGFDESFPQYMLTDYCVQFGPVKSITMVHRAKCAFVTFTTKKAAQEFAAAIHDNGSKKAAGLLVIEKYSMRVAWGQPAKLGYTTDDQKKISLVADSVMRQLAGKDRAGLGEKRPRVGTQEKARTKKSLNSSK